MKITTRTTIPQVAEMLAEDGYDPSLAPAVRKAALAGCLLWTAERLTTTDRSRIDARPQ